MISNHGYWGSRTATIDWCESNYEVTHYIAEFWNTLSNFVLILFPSYGIYWSYKHIDHSNRYSNKNFKYFTVPIPIILCYLGLIVVGLGSWMFHMTLLYPMQLLDELPMIFGSGILIFANYDILLSCYKHNRITNSKKTRLEIIFYNKSLVFVSIMFYCCLIAYIYLYVWTNPVFHELSYSIMVVTIIGQNITLIKWLGLAKRLYVMSFFYYMFGFFLWNLDNNLCEYLKAYRKSVETWFGVSEQMIEESNIRAVVLNILVVSLKSVSEFHSLWHIFTGYASFMNILFLTEVHYEFYLKSNKLIQKKERPTSGKFKNLYYNLNSSLIQVENGSILKLK